jgi:hypothetical protein
MQQLMGGKKQDQGGLAALASQFLGGGSNHNQSSGSGSGSGGGTGSLVSALAGSLLGGKKPSQQQQQQDYSGSHNTQHSQGGGFMQNLGTMFGGHQSSSVRWLFTK